jgi:hypothetical protein
MIHVLGAALPDVEHPQVAQALLEKMVTALVLAISEEGQFEVLAVQAEVATTVLKMSHNSIVDAQARAAATSPPPFGSPAGGTGGAAAGGEGDRPYNVIVVPLEQCADLLEQLQIIVEVGRRRIAEAVKELAANPDADEDDRERLELAVEPCNDLIEYAIDATGYLIKSHGAKIIPALSESMGAYMLEAVAEELPMMDRVRSAAVCVFDDLIEHASPEAHFLLPTFLPHLLAFTQSADPFLRQTSVYGLGVCAQHGGPDFEPTVAPALQALQKALARPEAREDVYRCATENAVSALIKCLRFRPASAGAYADVIMPGVLAFLPFTSDEIEARLVHGLLVDGVTTQDEMWVGKGGAWAAQALTALAKALIAHAKATEKAVEEGDGDDEAGEAEDDEPLFEERSLTTLTNWFASVRGTAVGSGIVAVARTMKKAHQRALAEYGLAA